MRRTDFTASLKFPTEVNLLSIPYTVTGIKAEKTKQQEARITYTSLISGTYFLYLYVLIIFQMTVQCF